GGDHADFARAVDIAPALGNLAEVVRLRRLERPALGDAAHDLGGGHDVVHAPAVGAADVHELDETYDVPGAAPALGHREDVIVVRAALHHHVDLDRSEAGGSRGFDAFQHPGYRVLGIVHGAESGIVERIEAHRDAVQPGLPERGGVLCEERAVG